MENEFFMQRKPKVSKRILALVVALGLICTIYVMQGSKNSRSIISEYELQLSEFNLFLSKHQKNYSPEELQTRFSTFRDNSAYIRLHNSLNKNWVLGLNQFSDMTHEEFKSSFLTTFPKMPLKSNFSETKNIQSVPSFID